MMMNVLRNMSHESEYAKHWKRQADTKKKVSDVFLIVWIRKRLVMMNYSGKLFNGETESFIDFSQTLQNKGSS